MTKKEIITKIKSIINDCMDLNISVSLGSFKVFDLINEILKEENDKKNKREV